MKYMHNSMAYTQTMWRNTLRSFRNIGLELR